MNHIMGRRNKARNTSSLVVRVVSAQQYRVVLFDVFERLSEAPVP